MMKRIVSMKGNILVFKNNIVFKKNATYSKLFGLQMTETQFRQFKHKEAFIAFVS